MPTINKNHSDEATSGNETGVFKMDKNDRWTILQFLLLSKAFGSYGIFSVSPKGVSAVIEYIKNQRINHQNMSFKDEYRKFLKKYGVDLDERHLWD
jgi:hypothetical protein